MSQGSKLSRVHLRLAAATIVLAGAGGGSIAILAQGEFSEPPPAQPLQSVQAAQPETEAPPAQIASRSEAPAAEAPEPPARARGLEGNPSLPPLAKRWRKAVLLSRRDQVMAGANALRKSPDGKDQLLALMEDANPRVRAFALRELGRRRDPSLTPELTRFLTDPDPYVAENARWALDTLEGIK